MSQEHPGPVVSAIIPAYQRPRRTRRAIDSVAAQTYRPLELIVVDDGSEPPLEEHLSLPSDDLTRAAVLRQERNQGPNVARNRGIEAASGSYFAFLDSDDEWLPEKIERQVAGLQANSGAEVSYTGCRLVDAEGRLNSIRRAEAEGDLLDRLLREDVVGTYSVVMTSRSAVELVGGPDPEIPAWQDWEWYLRLAAEVEFDAVGEPLVVKHTGGDGVGGSYRSKRDGAYPIMEERIRTLARTPRLERLGLAYLDCRLGYRALVTGHYSAARRSFLEAIRRSPLELQCYLYLLSAGPHYPWLQRLKRDLVRLIH